MIQRFVDAWERNKPLIRRMFAEKHPGDYDDVVLTVLAGLRHEAPSQGGFPDPAATLVIEGDSYQGTNTYLLVDSFRGGEPRWYVRVDYGSCSGCDTLCSIHTGRRSDRPTDEQVDEYMTLALHIVQSIKEFE